MSRFKYFLVFWFCIINAIVISTAFREGEGEGEKGRGVWDLARPFVKREDRVTIFANENGEVSAARVSDRVNGSAYLLQFITLEPNSLFLPVLLHADMVFYVHTGTGTLAWNEEDEMKHANVKGGDVYRLPAGTVFFAQSNQESYRPQELRIYAIFATSINDLREPSMAPYTSISDLVLGFDKDVLQAAFQAPGPVIEEILSGTKQPAIIHGDSEIGHRVSRWDKEMEYVKQIVQPSIMSDLNKKKKKKKKDKEEEMFNIMEEDKDFENCNGWSTTITRKNLDALEDSDIGIFMVNLTTGSMMGPHWNPMATEIAVVLKGQGMVRVVCPKTYGNVAKCRNRRFHVKEGDVFVVPRFHPMAQMAFNNGSFVFMGFSTSAKNNNPQFLAGKASVYRTLNVNVVAASFNVPNTTITRLLAAQEDMCILECVSCAEEEFQIMVEEMGEGMEEKKEREEEAREREAEKAREEEERKEREEEARRKREEEERRKEEEEEAERGGEEPQPREEKEGRSQERARRAEEEARRRAEERDRRASEEARRAAEEEQERERRHWEPQECRSGRREQGRREWEPEEGRGRRGDRERRQWEHHEGRGGREEPGGGRGKWDDERRHTPKRLTI